MGEFGIGQPVRRFEDKRLLSGNGRFQNDNNLHGQLAAYVLRSPHAHARIRKLKLTAALGAPGVALIMTGDDLVEAKLGVMGVPFQRKRPDGSPMFARAFLASPRAPCVMSASRWHSSWPRRWRRQRMPPS